MFDLADAMRRAVIQAAGLAGLDRLARPWLGGCGVVLMLHRVTVSPRRPGGFNAGLTVAPAFLDALIGAMKRDGFSFVSMDEAVERLRGKPGGGRFAALTADDGYRDNLHEALPVLRRHGAPLTVFVAPALIDRTLPLWWEALEDIVEAGRPITLPGSGERLRCNSPAEKAAAFRRLSFRLCVEISEAEQTPALEAMAAAAGIDPYAAGREILLDWRELQDFARDPLVSVGAHTLNHVNLRRLDPAEVRAEMEGSRDRLAGELGQAPRHFAYPYGFAAAAGRREAELAQAAGFTSAVTTRHGVLHRGHADHLHALPRVSLNGRFQKLSQARVMTRGLTVPLANRGRVLVTV